MNRTAAIILATVCAASAPAEDFLDRVDEALTRSLFDDRFRVRLSGTLDLEAYHVSQPPFGLINTTSRDVFNPRLSLFLDVQAGSSLYAFVQARVDRGYDPSDDGPRGRLDEYAIRWSPYSDGRFNLQAGKFSTVVGSWMSRHLSWDNPFITAPVPYERVTAISDFDIPSSAQEFTHGHDEDSSYDYNPVLWGAVYTSGLSISGKLGMFEYAAELKNAAPSSRPDSWDAREAGFSHPTYGARLGLRPTPAWNLGLSASHGPYLRREVQSLLPAGRGIGDYEQTLLGADLSFARRHLQIWGEAWHSRFDVPRVGNADTFTYFIEAKYKLTTESFAALRWNQQFFSEVPDGTGGTKSWGRDLWRTDAALGYRFTPHTQLKLQYSLEHEAGPRDFSHMVGAQFTVRF